MRAGVKKYRVLKIERASTHTSRSHLDNAFVLVQMLMALTRNSVEVEEVKVTLYSDDVYGKRNQSYEGLPKFLRRHYEISKKLTLNPILSAKRYNLVSTRSLGP